ncbi:MAG: hypothetical protein JSS04_21490 [Proteobacteria bacterium]|nr:hypothetical protein [Pseudomonadota bacterium]
MSLLGAPVFAQTVNPSAAATQAVNGQGATADSIATFIANNPGDAAGVVALLNTNPTLAANVATALAGRADATTPGSPLATFAAAVSTSGNASFMASVLQGTSGTPTATSALANAIVTNNASNPTVIANVVISSGGNTTVLTGIAGALAANGSTSLATSVLTTVSGSGVTGAGAIASSFAGALNSTGNQAMAQAVTNSGVQASNQQNGQGQTGNNQGNNNQGTQPNSGQNATANSQGKQT